MKQASRKALSLPNLTHSDTRLTKTYFTSIYRTVYFILYITFSVQVHWNISYVWHYIRERERDRETEEGNKKDETVFEATEKEKDITKDFAGTSHPRSHMASSDKLHSSWDPHIAFQDGHAPFSFNVTVSPLPQFTTTNPK